MSDLQPTRVLSVLVIDRHSCTGGAQSLVAEAHAPVCPSLVTPLFPSRARYISLLPWAHKVGTSYIIGFDLSSKFLHGVVFLSCMATPFVYFHFQSMQFSTRRSPFPLSLHPVSNCTQP